ncbi:MAG: hypothetical protein IJ748_02175 [Bacteroidales bacterium]|nr:hypothetical protein [Bacteroidales bacterium]
MEEQAEVAQEKKLTPKNWEKEFGESGLVDTPIGKVRMGDNQYLKLARKGREGKLGMIRPTLENPDVIIEEVSQAKEDQETERTSSYIFVKSFKKKDGSRYYYFTSVTVSKDGQEVVISNQEKTEKRISKLLRESGTIWINSKFSLHPTTQIEEPVLHDDTNRLTQSGNQSAMLGIRSSELEGKDTGKNKNDKGNKKKDEYVKGDKIVLHIKKGDVETEAEYGDYNGKEFEVLGMRRGFIVVDNEGKEMIINPKKKGISIKKTAGAENETAKGEERDENGIPFVKASDGTTIFGEIKQETGLAPAPIRLSEGINYKNNQGYGLKHIKAKHGEQILNAGYETVEEFIEDVAKNFDTIKKGNTRATNETYLLEITDKYNHTLYIELSKDGSYWNINSAGIFKKGYSKKKSVVWTLPALSRSTNTDAAGVTHGTTKGATVTSGNSPQTTDSDGKVTGKSETDKENKEKSLKERLKTGEVIEDGADKARAKFEASEKVLGRETSAGTQETTTEDKALLDAVVDKLKEAIGEENVITDNAEAQRVLEEVNGKGTQDIEAINNQFNEDFQQQIDGKLPREHTYQLGQPSNILLSAGIPNLPIELKASRLLDKSMQNEHPFDLSEIKNIVNSIHNPLVVFRSATHIGSNVILTELKHGKRSFVVAIETNRKQGKIHINSIRSIHYRTSLNLINWINNGLAEYIKPTFAEEWLNPIKTELLSQPQYNSTDVRKQLNSAAKIIQEFENPTINGEKKAKQQNREGEDEKENKVFNEELRDFKEGKLKSGRLHLGGPKGLLRSCGLNASEILLSAKTLKEHLNKHNIGVEEIKDLPKAINEPLMVYEWGTKAKSSIIITNITRENGEKITVAVKVDRDGQHLNVNKIASIHGKNSKRFISDMLSEGEHNIENSLKYVQENKKEVLDWLGMDSPKESASLTNEELRIAKVIENFDTEKFLKQNLVQEHRVYHGSGADFEAFDFSHMGEGEGAQAFGWGGYVTEVEGIGRTYAEKLRPELLGKYQENIVINKIAQQKFDSYNGDIVRAIEDFRKILNEPWCDKKRVKKAIRILESGKKLPEGRLHSTYIYTVEIPDDKEVTEKDNRNYNAQIRSYEEGLMKSNEYIRLGSPKGVIKAFMPESDIIMRRKVLTKARKKHNLLPMSLLNLPKAIAKPIFVFKSSEMTVSVLTELKDGNGKNIFVAIELNAEKQLGHEVLEVNDILTVHGRDIENIVKPIAENESLLWVDKEKGSRWLSSAKSNSQAIATETLNSAAKIIQEFENPKFYEYKVGEYLEWDKEAGERLINKVAKELDKRGVEIEYSLPEYIRGYSTADKLRYIVHNMSESNKGSVRDLYRELETILKRTEKGGDKAASKLLHDIGYIGIKYPAQYLSGGRSDGAMNYVIFDEKDLKITDKVRFFKTKSGQAYGFTVKGKVYIDTKIAGAGTPIHEYTHLWATALRQSNPKEWENIVELMKRDKYLWDKTRKMYPELQSDEEIADEVLAHYSGKRGAERLAEEVRKIKAEKGGNIFDKARALRAIQNVKEALERFWREVADFFNIHFNTAEEIADKVLSDMLNGVNPNEYIRRGGNRGNAVKNNKAYSSEEQSIIEKAKKEGTYMKAPNGKRTNLTEKQWVQVRTKAFKEWFGDWEKTARIDKLRKSKNIEATGNEYKGKYELNNKSADNYIKETLRGEYTNKDIKETIKITRIGAEKVTRHDAESEIHLKSVALIPQMLENAIFITEETNEKAKRGFDSYKYYVVGLKINGVDYTAKLVVGVKNGQTYYDHSLTEISKEKLLNERDRISTSVYQKEQSFDIDNVKDKRLLSILEGNSSKVVDENGEPMVVYHGTPIRFTVFDTPTNMPRIFTAKNVSFAEMYGEEPMALFANLRNPLEVDYKGGDAFEPIEVDGVKIEDIEELAAYARTKGYDGVVARNVKDAGTRTSKKQVSDEVIVFEPTQIKSATDNIGTFDKENNDIRFEKAEEERKRHLESVNAKFNEDLQQQIDGKLPKEHTYQLGQPSTVLKSVGIPNLPIELKASRLSSKSKQENHPFDLEDVKDLVKAIQNPLAIFEYGDKSKAQNIIVEISKGGKNFLVGLSLNPKNLQINDVRGIFPKDSSEWLNWISQGKALYLDKEKIQTLINQQRINLAEVDYLDLNSVAKIIENFENPHIEEKNSEENIRFEKEDNDIDEVNNRFSEELDNFARGEMRSSDKFHLGKPNETLRACGLNAGEIIMTQSVLQNHLKKHGLTTQEIKDLPKAINEPLMVYEWGTKAKNTVVITSIERGNERITISIRLNKNGKGIEVNEISSVHGKSMERLMNEITTEKSDFGKDNLKYVDKEKVFNWFAMETPKVSSQNNQRLNSVAKVIENFENPHIEEENSEENIRFEKIVEEETEGEEEKLSEEEIREREIEKLLEEVEDEEKKSVYREVMERIGKSKAGEKVMSFADDYHSLRVMEDKVVRTMRKRIKGFRLPFSVYEQQIASKSATEGQIILFTEQVVKPLMRKVQEIAGKYGLSEKEVEQYLMFNFYGERTDEIVFNRWAEYKRAKESGTKPNEEYRQEYEKVEEYKAMLSDEEKKACLDDTEELFEKMSGEKSYDSTEEIDKEWQRLNEEALARRGAEKYREAELWSKESGEGIKGFAGEEGMCHTALYQTMAEKYFPEAAGDMDKTRLSPKVITGAFRDMAGDEECDELERLSRAVNDYSSERALEGRSISREEYERYKRQKYYVPLRGWDKDGGEVSVFGADDVFQGINPNAKGRKTTADSPLKYMFAIACGQIQRCNDNEAKRNLAEFVNRYKKIIMGEDAVGYWSWTDREGNAQKDTKKPKKKDYMEGTLVYNIMNKEYDRVFPGSMKKHLFEFKDGKRVYRIYFASTHLADVLNGKGVGLSGAVVDKVRKTTRFMASMRTSKNPAFAAANFVRDSAVVLFLDENRQEEYPNFRRTFLKNLAKMQTVNRSIFNGGKSYRGSKADNEMQKLYNQWVYFGGMSGYNFFLEDLDKEFERRYKDMNKSKVKKALGNINIGSSDFLDVFAMISEVTENQVRFAAFRTYLECSERAGNPLTIREAVYKSKEATLNFSRSGWGARTVGALFPFFNATCQGLIKLARLLRYNPYRLIRAICLFLAAGMTDAWLSMLLGGDDDKKNKYLQVNEYVQERNIIIGGVKIPIPQEMYLPFTIGVNMAKTMKGKMTGTEAKSRIINAMGELLPSEVGTSIGALVEYDRVNDRMKMTKHPFNAILSAVSPGMYQPIADYNRNRDFMDSPILPGEIKEEGYNKKTAQAGRYDEYKTYGIYQDMAFWWNNVWSMMSDGEPISWNREYYEKIVSSGNTLRKKNGEIGNLRTVSPQAIQYFVGQYAPGINNIVTKNADIFLGRKELSAENIPIIDRLAVRHTEHASLYKKSSLVYDILEQETDYKNLDKEKKEAKKYGEDVARFDKAKKSKSVKVAKRYGENRKKLQRLRTEVKLLRIDGAVKNKKKIDELLDEQEKIYDKILKDW